MKKQNPAAQEPSCNLSTYKNKNVGKPQTSADNSSLAAPFLATKYSRPGPNHLTTLPWHPLDAIVVCSQSAGEFFPYGRSKALFHSVYIAHFSLLSLFLSDVSKMSWVSSLPTLHFSVHSHENWVGSLCFITLTVKRTDRKLYFLVEIDMART